MLKFELVPNSLNLLIHYNDKPIIVFIAKQFFENFINQADREYIYSELNTFFTTLTDEEQLSFYDMYRSLLTYQLDHTFDENSYTSTVSDILHTPLTTMVQEKLHHYVVRPEDSDEFFAPLRTVALISKICSPAWISAYLYCRNHHKTASLFNLFLLRTSTIQNQHLSITAMYEMEKSYISEVNKSHSENELSEEMYGHLRLCILVLHQFMTPLNRTIN